MPNIGALLREEITRLARKESRSQVDPAKKAASQHRADIAALKRQVAQLERQVRALARTSAATPRTSAPTPAASGLRFVAKGLRSQRTRLGLSAGQFGTLVGVSAQSIYNWESGTTRPRGAQIAKIATLRSLGKREAAQRLEQLGRATGGRSARR